MPDAYSFRSGDDFGGDHIANRDEYVLGLNPTLAEPTGASLNIRRATNGVVVEFGTAGLSGMHYGAYTHRLFTLDVSTNSPAGNWTGLPGFTDLAGSGQTVAYTNPTPEARGFYRYRARLLPVRSP
jgi:hypothetical protein